MKILLVDDNESVRLTTSVLLEDAGHLVREAGSLAEARACLAEGEELDVVLLDLHLGDGDGTELIPEIRRSRPAARIAILSGSTGQIVADADATIEKAMDPAELIAAIERLAGSAR